MIYTAQYVMCLMRADPLRGQVGGGTGPPGYTAWRVGSSGYIGWPVRMADNSFSITKRDSSLFDRA
jgi:hypothetical protein